ncbi:hypothetical protein [Arthrobacter sp. NPDC056493]|uniref:hypothetical protein n=1 Tax=Arthrobacter sp. NPDC056493 TaxID=3345839 RepID=UPI003672A37F
MSISAGHRAIVSAFGWGHGPARRAAAAVPAVELPVSFPAPSAAMPAAVGPSTVEPAAVEPGTLVCSPWEGLYLAQAHPVTARGDGATARQQLDSFLNSLMYGE